AATRPPATTHAVPRAANGDAADHLGSGRAGTGMLIKTKSTCSISAPSSQTGHDEPRVARTYEVLTFTLVFNCADRPRPCFDTGTGTDAARMVGHFLLACCSGSSGSRSACCATPLRGRRERCA